MAQLFLAGMTIDVALVAAKVMDQKELDGRSKEDRVPTEREILVAINHPFLPCLYSVTRATGGPAPLSSSTPEGTSTPCASASASRTVPLPSLSSARSSRRSSPVTRSVALAYKEKVVGASSVVAYLGCCPWLANKVCVGCEHGEGGGQFFVKHQQLLKEAMSLELWWPALSLRVVHKPQQGAYLCGNNFRRDN